MFRRTLLAITFSALLWLPHFGHAQTNSATERALLLALIDSLQQQIAQLEAELARREADEIDSSRGAQSAVSAPTVYQNLPRGLSIKSQYTDVTPDTVEDIRSLHDRLYLERIFELFPDRYDQKLHEFLVFEDQRARFDGYVTTIPPTHQYWAFAVNEVVLRDVGDEASDELIVHELAHVVSYDSMPDGQPRDCPMYFADRGCPATDSYLLAYADTFWSETDLTRADRWARSEDGFAAAEDYFVEHESEYVSDYAAASPEEDFAESFALYVVDPVPRRNGEIRSQKVWWFDQFPELRAIKEYVNRRR